MNDTVDKLVIFLAKRDGIDKLVKTFQYVSKLARWQVEASHPRRCTEIQAVGSCFWPREESLQDRQVSHRLQCSQKRIGTLDAKLAGRMSFISAFERRLLISSKEGGSEDAEESLRKMRADRVMRLMAVAANVADFIIALADIEPNPFCNHAVTLGVSGLVSAWAGWYRNWPS
ncbi:hypothetical protein OIU77_027269 [Salix suchowensis]|uniref:Peroxisomal membrane protein 11B n=1 Tax=Salix suchowensis TaxID=1278906 RepID=A0ABQ9BP19_9ROSI|nr:hypothetical protein OIU77_027269 [Salix suchowensis]